MKKIIILCSLILMYGCTLKEAKASSKQSSIPYSVKEFTYKGHKYIGFERYNMGGYSWGGVVHNPDCPCHTIQNKN